MKIFRSSCIDKQTGLEIVASEVSFNMACSYLETFSLGKYLGTEHVKTVDRLRFEKRSFIYDENRGLLLGEYGGKQYDY